QFLLAALDNPIPVRALGVLGVVYGLLFFVATIVGTILFLAGQPRSGVRRVGRAISLTCGSVCVLFFLALTWFGVRTSSTEHFEVRSGPMPPMPPSRTAELQPRPVPEQPTALPPQVIAQPRIIQRETAASPDAGLTRLPEAGEVAPPVKILPPQNGQDDRTTTATTTPKRPAWTNLSEIKQGDVTHVVLASQQYSTIEEARQELAKSAKTLLTRDFESVYRTSAEGLRNVSLDTLKVMAVRQEYVETVDRDFGSFYAPMHRVWWQLELSPEVRMNLRQIWKAQVQEFRTLTVGGTLLVVTASLAGLSLLTRRRPAVMG
ncbi:MAG TPA: hypothetical protein VM165_12940, partial [Planctomycetaceae bacterium]|nr:hypothetical protein [Planctomycetaceae bacterium]